MTNPPGSPPDDRSLGERDRSLGERDRSSEEPLQGVAVEPLGAALPSGDAAVTALPATIPPGNALSELRAAVLVQVSDEPLPSSALSPSALPPSAPPPTALASTMLPVTTPPLAAGGGSAYVASGAALVSPPSTAPGVPALDALVEATAERVLPDHARLPSDPLGLEMIDDADVFDGPTAELTRPPLLDMPGRDPLPPIASGVLDELVAAAATLPPEAQVAPPLTFLDENTLAQLPAYSDDNDPLTEQTADLEPADQRVKTSSDGSAEASSEKPLEAVDGATVEGAPVVDEQGTEVGPLPPDAGHAFVADDGGRVRLEDSLGEQGGCVFFRARVEGEEQPYTAVWTASTSSEPPWAHLPDPRVVRPRCRVTLERAALRVFERPKGNTVVDYLSDDERVLPAMATIELGIELAELLEGLHGAGQFILDLDPSQIVIERGGRVRLYAVSGLYGAGAVPTGQLGLFVAPEVRRRLTYRMGAHSDVYACALLLYALLAKRAPIDVDLDPSLLESPRVFRPECPLGIWPFLRACLEPNPARRVGHARGLKQLLERARTRLINEARAAEEQRDVVLEAWAEQHTGLAKARRGSGQQDRALSVTDEGGRVGLYMISDGVSRSRFGDGAFAAEQAELAALQRWGGLEKGGQAALELTHTQRADILKQISRSAGKRISAEVNAKYAPIANEPNQVMSATMSAMFVVRGEATFGNLGDSRAYLVRDGTIEQVSIDHDRCTDALRMGLTFREAANVSMGSALTRVVGRVIVDDDGTTRPDPFEPEMFRVRLLPGDRVVLCSDGIADFAAGAGAPPHEADAKILETMMTWEDPARAAFELVVLANRAGGFDNISCVIVAVHEAQ